MNTANEQDPIESQTGPDDIIDTQTDRVDAEKDKVQEKLEGSAPSKEETEVNPEDAKIRRSE
ncbi:MAG: hypothetical protein V4520_07895 [Bacteroidota bacterium]